MSRNQNNISFGFRDASGNCANSELANKLDIDSSISVRAFKIKNKLLQILYRVDVVMRWWRD
jgi:hypothetical protein